MIKITTTRDNRIKVNGVIAGRLILRNGSGRHRHWSGPSDWWAEISFADARSIGPLPSRKEALEQISEHIRTVMREG